MADFTVNMAAVALQAVEGLGDAICEAEAVAEAFEALAGDDSPPPWVHVFRTQLRRVREASESVEVAVRRLTP